MTDVLKELQAYLDGDNSVVMSKRLVNEIIGEINRLRKKTMNEFPYLDKLAEECPYETKLAVTAWVFANIDNHIKEGGSFRYLIYDRLGFGGDAYVPLYCAGGMNISNACNDIKGIEDDN